MSCTCNVMTYDLYIINLFCFIFIIRIFKLVLKSYLTAKRIFFSHLPPLSPTRSLSFFLVWQVKRARKANEHVHD